MHRKSIEAQHKLNEESGDLKDEEGKEKNELKTESINSLRAKAQEHSAKIRECIYTNDPLKDNAHKVMMSHHHLPLVS